MRFLLLNQFYPPDPAPTGHYLHDLAQVLVARGHEVEVLCSRRSYDGSQSYLRSEVVAGVQVTRLAATGFGRRGFVGKLSDYATFYGNALRSAMFRRRPDVILSLTTPPYIGLLGKLAAKRHRCSHANWVMDLYPDVMYAHGMARERGIVFRGLRRLTRFQFAGSQPIIVLGDVMANRVANHMHNGSARNLELTLAQATRLHQLRFAGSVFSPIVSIPLWSTAGLSTCPESESHALRAQRGWADGETVFLYSGNMGLGHRFEEFLDAARHLGRSGPRWVFCGGGKRRVEIERFIAQNETGGMGSAGRWPAGFGGSPNPASEHCGSPQTEHGKMVGQSFQRAAESSTSVACAPEQAAPSQPKIGSSARVELMSYVEPSRLSAHLCAADVHLMSLEPAWQGLMVPSKLQASFAVGRPVLYVGGLECETAAWIQESGGGWVVPVNDPKALRAAIAQALDPAERQQRGQAALKFARQHFDQQTTCTRLAELLEGEGKTTNEHQCTQIGSRDEPRTTRTAERQR